MRLDRASRMALLSQCVSGSQCIGLTSSLFPLASLCDVSA